MTEFEQTPIEKETEADARAEAKAWAGAATQPIEAAGPLSGEIIANTPLGLWADTWRRLKRNRLALVGLGIIIVFLIVGGTETIFAATGWHGGYLAPYNPNAVNYTLSPQGLGSAPSMAHPFGTDYLGRDLLSRVLVATRVSLLVGVIAVAIALVIGLIARRRSPATTAAGSTRSSCASPTSSSPTPTFCSCCSS